MNLTIPASPTLPMYNNPSSMNLAMTSCPDYGLSIGNEIALVANNLDIFSTMSRQASTCPP